MKKLITVYLLFILCMLGQKAFAEDQAKVEDQADYIASLQNELEEQIKLKDHYKQMLAYTETENQLLKTDKENTSYFITDLQYALSDYKALNDELTSLTDKYLTIYEAQDESLNHYEQIVRQYKSQLTNLSDGAILDKTRINNLNDQIRQEHFMLLLIVILLLIGLASISLYRIQPKPKTDYNIVEDTPISKTKPVIYHAFKKKKGLPTIKESDIIESESRIKMNNRALLKGPLANFILKTLGINKGVQNEPDSKT